MKESIKNRIDAVRRGEVPEGYKKAYPYIIPDDWHVAKLGTICARTSRPNRDGKERPAYSINNKKGVVPQNEQFEEGSYQNLDKTAYKIVKKGEFAYNPARVNVGSIGRLRDEAEVIVSSLYVCVSVNSAVDGEYFDAWTKTDDFYKETVRNTEGSVREYLFYENFANMRMPIPPLAEQQKIAEILATCDRALELKKKLLEEKRKQKQWLMQKLLDPSSGVRLPGFENSIWQKATMSSLFDFGSSMSKSRDELSDEGDLYLHYGDIHANERYYIDATKEYDSIPKYEGISPEKTHLHSGDVVFIDASEDYDGISKFVVIENCDGLTFISGLHTVPCHSRDDRLTLHFKRYCFQTYLFKKQMAYYANGMKVYGVSGKDFANVEIVFPGHEEQRAIANVLDAISTNIELLQDEVKVMEGEKKALMQLLLTGLVRVNA